MVIDPPVTLPADGNPERFMQQEHAPPALVVVTLGGRHASLLQSQIDETPTILRVPEPLSKSAPINTLLLCPPRRPAGERAKSPVLTEFVDRRSWGRGGRNRGSCSQSAFFIGSVSIVP